MMRRTQFLSSTTLGFLLAACASMAGPATAGTLTTLYTFSGGADGGNPIAGLIPGPGGSFFGTTTAPSGTIFQLSPPAKGQTVWTLTTLYTFTGAADGSYPENLITDKSGALYGITNMGGIFNGTCAYGGTDYGCGTVFKLAPPAQAQTAWTLTTLYAFPGGTESSSPTGGVVMDANGSLYGFTAGIYTCPNGQGICGSAYRLTPTKNHSVWTETALYTFTGGTKGAYAGFFGSPIISANGSIFGITGSGGNITARACVSLDGCGSVFQLTPPAPGASAWTMQTLLAFDGLNGNEPVGGLSMDEAGNLYGGTNAGGKLKDCRPGGGYPNGCGVAYEVSPPTNGGSAWATTILHKFTNGADGGYPYDAPIFTANATYMTTSGDEATSFGSIAQLLPPHAGKTHWEVKTKFTFSNDANGASPTGPLVARGRVLYGTTNGGGVPPAANGTIFAFRP